MTSKLSPFNIALGTYDGTIAGLSVQYDDPKDYTSALTLSTDFATSTHASAVRSVALHGSLLATGGADETIHLYNVRSRVELGTFLHHDSTITSLSFANDNGRTLLFSSGGKGDSAICVWHKENQAKSKSDWSLLRRLEGHAPDTGGIRDVAVHPSTAVCLSVADDRALFMWNLKKGKIAFSVKTKRVVNRVAWSPLGSRYVLAGEGGIVTVADIGGRDIQTWECGNAAGDVGCAAFLDEDVVACGSDDGIVRLWDAREKENTEGEMIMRHESRLSGLQVVDGLLVTVDAGGGLKIWDMRMRGEPRIETDMATKGRITCMDVAHQMHHPSPRADENDGHGDDADDEEQSSEVRKGKIEEELRQKPEGTASQRKRKKRKTNN